MVVAHFEKFRDCGDARAQEVGKKNKCNHNKSDGRAPFPTGNGQAIKTGALARHADKLLSGNICGNQGKADEPPGQPATGEKVLGSTLLAMGLFTLGFVQPDKQNRRHESNKYDDINNTHVSSRRV